MKLSILKCHGSSNDFILLDETIAQNSQLNNAQRAALSRTLCNRNRGVGADGILFYQTSKTADCNMRMHNPDGSEAEMCGNGLRCIGRYCAEKQLKQQVTVETMKSVLSVQRTKQIFAGIETFEAEIGPVSLLPSTLPMRVETDVFKDEIIENLSARYRFTALSVPNPHIVTIVSDIDPAVVEQCGAKANNTPLFPRGVNVSFVQALGRNRIFVVTYERGVGITNSCGTAMSASAYVSVLHNLSDTGQPIAVYNKGGMVECGVNHLDANITLKGNATFVFDAQIEVSDDGQSIVRQFESQVRRDETCAYGALQEYVNTRLKK